MDPIIGAGLLSLGGSLFGSSSASKSHKQSLSQAQQQFDAQMDTSVQRRVADAKKAGIHPLFALGGSVGASPTISAGGSSEAGNILSSGIGKLSAAIMEASGQKKLNEAQAAYYNSLAAKNEQDGASRGRDGVQGSVNPIDTGPDVVYGPPEHVSPQVKFSQDRGLAAGTHPEKIKVMTRDGRSIEIPNPDLGMDEVGQIEYVYNKAKHWTTDRIEDYINANRKLSGAAKRALRSLFKRTPSPRGNYEDYISP